MAIDTNMVFVVKFKNNKILEGIKKMPTLEQKKLSYLIDDLETNGPIQAGWKNYSKLGKNKFHCHLSYKWVVCWECDENTNNSIKIIEVYYAGSRENAPY